jgi:3-methyladenine DNA glycosylase AlkD
MIADPAAVTPGLLNAWAKVLDNYVLTDAFASIVARSQYRRNKAEQWMTSAGEWTGSVGWSVATAMAMEDDLPDSYFIDLLKTIEAEIHGRKNRVRYAMNNALIAIGMRNKALEKKAIASAKRIGPVEVDHGETGCKTPEAVGYIKKAAARKR